MGKDETRRTAAAERRAEERRQSSALALKANLQRRKAQRDARRDTAAGGKPATDASEQEADAKEGPTSG